MKREQLEHVLRAASRIVDERDFLVVGSAAALGTFDDDQLPPEASRSRVVPRRADAALPEPAIPLGR